MNVRELFKEQGKWEGREEEKQKMILSMLRNNIDPETVSKVSGLSKKEIN